MKKKKVGENPAFELPPVKSSGMRELHSLDGALLLMHFGFRGLVAEADLFLQHHGLSRVHHRVLYAIARSESLSVGALLELLGVSKQALHKPLKQLQDEGYVVAQRDPAQHRSKILRLTAKGARIENAASKRERKAIGEALKVVKPSHRRAWFEIMAVLARRA
ncbi:MarR family transcriptional regulator [Pendulispora rubella]|uniref:MarR family transcriptional regulator n=1 Tax=Pendulispora rubella TaxID=2741070 RepID=A0ABZ2LFY5_9BACT